MVNDVDKITKMVCRIGDMVIKHTSNLKLYNKTNNKYENVIRKIKNNATKAGVNGLSSIYINNSYDHIYLESINPSVKTGNTYVPPPSVSFGYGDLTNLKTTLDFAKVWFEADEYRDDLFIYSKSNKPINVNSKYIDLNVVFKSHGYLNSSMRIEPYVISNNIGVDSYPGVRIRGSTGIIGHCSVDEFYELRTILLELIKNLYQNSLLLNILGGMCETK